MNRPAAATGRQRRLVAAGVPTLITCALIWAAAPDEITTAGETPPEATGDTPAVNPHFDPHACGACHTSGSPREAIAIEAVDAICLGCHDGRRARREGHPIGRPAVTAQARTPAGWPTLDGQLSCLTCHDVLAGCRVTGVGPVDNALFLRGANSKRSAALCSTCHDPELLGRHNPHRMLEPEGHIRAESCRYCHVDPAPDARTTARSGQARLVTDELTLCAGCHMSHIEFFDPGHIGRRLGPVDLGALKAFEVSVEGGTAAAPVDASVVLPLDAAARITCSTCHNPHPAGLFSDSRVLAAGAMRIDTADDGSALRLPAPVLCRACHAR